MKRRSFLAGSLVATLTTGAAALCGPAILAAQKSGAASGAAHPLAQSNDGVVIHPFESDLMKGFPPPKEKTVTPDTYPSSRLHRVWVHHHMRELCATRPIRRGDGEAAVLPRKPCDIDRLLVTGPGGKADPKKITKKSFLSPDVLLPGTAYRNQFWISGADATAYYAGGAYGQYCYVYPESKTVIVKFSTEEANDSVTAMTEIRAFGQIARALDK